MASLLIIEDEDSLRATLAERLSLEGFQVETAETGEKGIERARQERPDLILCDILMPGIDGYGVFRELRGRADTAKIPFVFLSAKTDPRDVRAALDLGVDDYLGKPVAKSDLLQAIHRQLHKPQPPGAV